MLFATVVTAIATVIIAAATIAYVCVSRKLWSATLETARRTEELARLAREGFMFQFITTYMDMNKALPSPTPEMKGKTFDVQQWYKDLDAMLSKGFPEVWEQMRKYLPKDIST